MRNGAVVAEFERAFASYVGARFAIALVNGTATLHTALVALGVKPGDKVAVPPLTMSATTIAVLQAGAVPVFVDVDEKTWLMSPYRGYGGANYYLPVSLYGLHSVMGGERLVDDAAQTLRPFKGNKSWAASFVSYSFQASKILSTGEGGMLVTDSEELATKAREFSSLGYRMRADQPRIDPAVLKSPTFDRHHSLGWNYRMNDVTAAKGLTELHRARYLLNEREACAILYREAIQGCDWLTPQHVPEGWRHDYWTFAVACDEWHRARMLSKAIVEHGGEAPFPAWQLTYNEPAFRYLTPATRCWIAESLQQRILQFQTNNVEAAEKNAHALKKAIAELSGFYRPRADSDATGIPCG